MAENVNLALELDLAMHLSLLIAVLSALFWRLGGLRMLVSQLRLSSRIRDLGFGDRHSDTLVVLRVMEVVLIAAGAVLALAFVWTSYRYFMLAELLVGPGANALDWSLYSDIWEASERVTDASIKVTVAVILAFVGSYGVSLICQGLRRPVREGDVPRLSHAHTVPSNWEGAHEGLWRERIWELKECKGLKVALRDEITEIYQGGGWHRNWRDWGKAVTGYRRHSAHELFPFSHFGWGRRGGEGNVG